MSRSVALSLTVLGLIATALYGEMPGPAAPEFHRNVMETLRADLAAMRDVSFRRMVVRRSLDRKGEESSVEVLESRVTPAETGFDELLTAIDGRPPTEAEIRRHRGAATFSKHHRQLLEGSVDFGLVADLKLSILLETYNYELAGEDVIHGTRCYRLLVTPSEPPKGATRTEKIAAASQGTFWITKEGQHLARLRVRLARPLRTMGVSLKALDLSLDQELHDGAWLMTGAEVRSEFKLGATVRKHNTWTYSDFRDLRRP